MGDAYGGLPLNIPVPGTNNAVADPLLDTLLAFFAAVINAHAAAAWDTVAKGTGGVPVKRTFAHNPADAAFTQAATPSLHLWRDSVQRAKQIAAEWRVRPSTLILRWVPFPVYQQERSRRLAPFFNAIPSILDAAVELGRDPAWVVAGDTDPVAATRGSLLWKYAPVHKLEVAREDIRRGQFLIPMEGDREPIAVESLDIPLDLEERLLRDPSGRDLLAYTQVTTVARPEAPMSLTTSVSQLDYDPDADPEP